MSFADPTERPNADRWHGDLLAMDPGVRSPGLALFRHGVLVGTTRLRIPEEYHSLPDGERWLRIADLAADWWQQQQQGVKRTVRTVIYERPQWYSETKGKSKGDPNKLAGVLGVGQSLAVIFAMHNSHEGNRPPEIITPTPAEWTRQVPKTDRNGKLPKDPRKSPRHAHVWSCLERGEQELCLIRDESAITNVLMRDVNNDAFDGMGLGLFALGRYVPGATGRVFAGATR